MNEAEFKEYYDNLTKSYNESKKQDDVFLNSGWNTAISALRDVQFTYIQAAYRSKKEVFPEYHEIEKFIVRQRESMLERFARMDKNIERLRELMKDTSAWVVKTKDEE